MYHDKKNKLEGLEEWIFIQTEFMHMVYNKRLVK